MIEFTITTVDAPGRGAVLESTLRSFGTHLVDVDLSKCHAYVNVDVHKGMSTDGSNGLIAVDRAFGSMAFNCKQANFPSAVKWCFEQPKGEYFIHLEDDWELLSYVRLEDMTAIMRSDAGLSCLNLRAYPGIQDERICLSPGLWRTEHARVIASRFNETHDPELQLRHGAADGFRGMCWPLGRRPIIKDIGRRWMRQHGLKKNADGGKRLTAWEKIAC